jgi:hypothetical protein
MSSPPSPAADTAATYHPPENGPRSDFVAAFGWIALGGAILIGSWTMDRLKNQDVNPYTVPGLLPGLLGIAMMLLGGSLLFRSWRRRTLRSPAVEPDLPHSSISVRQLWLAIGLCMTFDIVMIGHGLPFWLAATAFVSVAILTLQQIQRKAKGQRLTLRAAISAVAIGLSAGLAITVVFQQIFLVRLP